MVCTTIISETKVGLALSLHWQGIYAMLLFGHKNLSSLFHQGKMNSRVGRCIKKRGPMSGHVCSENAMFVSWDFSSFRIDFILCVQGVGGDEELKACYFPQKVHLSTNAF